MYYNCSQGLSSCRQEFSRCSEKNPAETGEKDDKNSANAETTSAAPAVDKTPRPAVMKPTKPTVNQDKNKESMEDGNTPSLQSGSGKIPESRFSVKLVEKLIVEIFSSMHLVILHVQEKCFRLQERSH